jgi:hypothetical protein
MIHRRPRLRCPPWTRIPGATAAQGDHQKRHPPTMSRWASTDLHPLKAAIRDRESRMRTRIESLGVTFKRWRSTGCQQSPARLLAEGTAARGAAITAARHAAAATSAAARASRIGPRRTQRRKKQHGKKQCFQHDISLHLRSRKNINHNKTRDRDGDGQFSREQKRR